MADDLTELSTEFVPMFLDDEDEIVVEGETATPEEEKGGEASNGDPDCDALARTSTASGQEVGVVITTFRLLKPLNTTTIIGLDRLMTRGAD
ncbi:unnamed protein product [Dibothriocephalus latus]|uniref:Uncharacterized protein n=1 Tax=Dibothriocephalus latus TaxID=60516 RepID=A0A3P7MZ29_DIBLA|nr:unnamed protein product [Dibothriocephalus latus]